MDLWRWVSDLLQTNSRSSSGHWFTFRQQRHPSGMQSKCVVLPQSSFINDLVHGNRPSHPVQVYLLFIISKIPRLKPFQKWTLYFRHLVGSYEEINLSVYYVSILFVVYGVLGQVVFGWQRTPCLFWPIRKTQATGSTPDTCWSSGVWNIVRHSDMSSWFGIKKNLDNIESLLPRESEIQKWAGMINSTIWLLFRTNSPLYSCQLAGLAKGNASQWNHAIVTHCYSVSYYKTHRREPSISAVRSYRGGSEGLKSQGLIQIQRTLFFLWGNFICGQAHTNKTYFNNQ